MRLIFSSITDFKMLATTTTKENKLTFTRTMSRKFRTLFHKPTHKEHTTRWTFWSIYVQFGLDGRPTNFLRKNPFSFVLVILELVMTLLRTTSYTRLLMLLRDDVTTLNDMRLTFQVTIFMSLFSQVITDSLGSYLKEYARPATVNSIKLIFDRLSGYVYHQSQPEIHDQYNTDYKYRAFNGILWMYDNTAEILTQILVQLVRSLVFTLYIIYIDSSLFLPFGITYFVLIKYVLPLMEKPVRNKDKADKLWNNTYKTMVANYGLLSNPALGQVISPPNFTETYMDILDHYYKMSKNWQDSNKILNIYQSFILYFISTILFEYGKYSTLLVLLMNSMSLTGLVMSINRLKDIEKNSSKSLEKLVKMLDAIDNQSDITNHSVKLPIVDPTSLTTSDNLINDHIKELTISKMDINLPNGSSIRLNSTHFVLKPGRGIILDGKTGCGKTVLTKNGLAGLSTDKPYTLTVSTDTKTYYNAHFSQLKLTRGYVNQDFVENLLINNSIKHTLGELFPGADSKYIRNYLISNFGMKSDVIPNNLDDTFGSKLSGGERQRVAVASFIHQICQTSTVQWLILDEIDRALDKDTAMLMVKNLFKYTKMYIIIITHLTEVKNMLIHDMRCIDQVWSYDTVGKATHVRVENI